MASAPTESLNRHEIRQLFVDHLKSYPFWNDSCEVHVVGIENGLSIAFRTILGTPAHTTYLDINILGDVFYLLHIELRVDYRGQGLGNRLYDTLVTIARKIGCRLIEQTASGMTVHGETRAEYLRRRGWAISGQYGEIAHKYLQTGPYDFDPQPKDTT